jgi:hypothetical protein
MRPFPGTRWFVRSKIMLGPGFGAKLPDSESKASTLMAYGIKNVLMLSTGNEQSDILFDGIEDAVLRLSEKTRARGWTIDSLWRLIEEGIYDQNHAGAGKILDAIFAAIPDFGLLYVCTDNATSNYIAWIWNRYYRFLCRFIDPDEDLDNPPAQSGITLFEAMKVPPLGYPAVSEKKKG